MILQRRFVEARIIAALIRKALHTTFSLRARVFHVQARGNETITIDWIDGPTLPQIDEIAQCYLFIPNKPLEIDGEEVYSPITRITRHRTISLATLTHVAQAYCTYHHYTLPLMEESQGKGASIRLSITLSNGFSLKLAIDTIAQQSNFCAPDFEETLSCLVKRTRSLEIERCSFCGNRRDREHLDLVVTSKACVECLTLEVASLVPDDWAMPEDTQEGQLLAALREVLDEQEELPKRTSTPKQRVQPESLIDENGRPYPKLRKDSEYGNVWWLKIPGKNDGFANPPRYVCSALKKSHWHFAGFRKEWRNANVYAKVPEEVYQEYGYVIEEDQAVEYAVQRGDRLDAAAIRHEGRSDEYEDRSNALVEKHLSTGVVVHGPKQNHKMERTFRRAERYKAQSKEEEQIAEWCRQHARSSRRHQRRRKQNVRVIYNRLERLRAERRKIIREYEVDVTRAYTASQGIPDNYWKKTPEQLAQLKAQRDEKLARLDPLISEDEQLLQQAGGLSIEGVKLEKGDMVYFTRRGEREVVRRNKKTITVWDDYGNPEKYRFERPLPIEEFSHVVNKADGTIVETYEQMLKRHGLTSEGVEYAPTDPKQERIFKVDEIQEVTIWADNSLSFFPTPPLVANQLFDLVTLIPPGRWLEPQGGTGALIEQAMSYSKIHHLQDTTIDTCEVQKDFIAILRNKGYSVYEGDFLTYDPDSKYKVVITNPPYSLPGRRWAWFDHIMHALELLEDDGLLLAILPMSFFFDDPKITAFREMVETYGDYVKLPAGAFSESGTEIATVLIAVWK